MSITENKFKEREKSKNVQTFYRQDELMFNKEKNVQQKKDFNRQLEVGTLIFQYFVNFIFDHLFSEP